MSTLNTDLVASLESYKTPQPGVVDRWLEHMETQEPGFTEAFYHVAKNRTMEKSAAFAFARENGYEGKATAMKDYMLDIERGVRSWPK